jgi:serine/threonine-protein phosphatase 2A regulatory subunit B''
MRLCFSVFDEHVRRSKVGGGNSREMDFESFLDFVLALENKDTPEGLTYLFRCLDLNGRGFLTTADIHTLFRYVIMYGLIYTISLLGSYDSC